MEHELQYYNQQQLWEGYLGNSRELARARETVRHIPNDVKTVLDIGCGNGVLTNMIDRDFVVGMDFANVPLRNVTKHAVCASIDEMPFKPDTFDLILVTEVLEHLPESIYLRALDEIARLHAKYLLISVPFDENLNVDVCKCDRCEHTFHPSHHCRTFTDDWYTAQFPGYTVTSVSYTSTMTTKNHTIARLKRQFDVYTDHDLVCCPICGGPTRSSNPYLKYAFKGLTLADIMVKHITGIKRPYHQIVLMTRQPMSTTVGMMENSIDRELCNDSNAINRNY